MFLFPSNYENKKNGVLLGENVSMAKTTGKKLPIADTERRIISFNCPDLIISNLKRICKVNTTSKKALHKLLSALISDYLHHVDKYSLTSRQLLHMQQVITAQKKKTVRIVFSMLNDSEFKLFKDLTAASYRDKANSLLFIICSVWYHFTELRTPKPTISLSLVE